MGKCPECGENLEGKDLEAHALGHWGCTSNNIDRLNNPLAKERFALVMKGGI